jgi:hypothetical protein
MATQDASAITKFHSKTSSTNHKPKIPDCLADWFKRPPTLKTEKRKTYWAFFDRVVQHINPQDIIGWLWVKDAVDLSWAILRLRRLQVDLIEIDRERCNATIEWQREHADEPIWDSSTGRHRPRTAAEIEERKNASLYNTETDTAGLVWRSFDQYERLDEHLAKLEARRDRILREIDLSRANFGQRLRAACDDEVHAQLEKPALAAE